MQRALPLLFLLLAGCASDLDGPDPITAAVDDLARLVGLSSGEERSPLSPPDSALPERAQTVPAGPSLLLSYGSQRKVATLYQSTGEQRLWRTEDGTAVATDGARVVATAGLSTWIAATRFDGPDPLDDPAALVDRPATARRVVDLIPPNRDAGRMRFGVALECRMRAVPLEGTILVEERCGGGARFVNRFWADPANGAIWRSEQWVGLEDRPMTVEVLTPPAN